MGIFSSKVVSPDEITDKDMVVLVIGPPGAGKTTFINTAAQRPNLQVEHNLGGGTRVVKSVLCTHKIDQRRVILVDTPPYPNDEEGPEYKIMDWLKLKKKAKVRGVIYLHKITDKKANPRPEVNFSKLGDVCGKDMKSVRAILATTMWGNCDGRPQAIERAEVNMENLGKSWEAKLNGGKAVRYENTEVSAWKIVQYVLGQPGIDLFEGRPAQVLGRGGR